MERRKEIDAHLLTASSTEAKGVLKSGLMAFHASSYAICSVARAFAAAAACDDEEEPIDSAAAPPKPGGGASRYGARGGSLCGSGCGHCMASCPH